ncbi:putative RTX toxin domain protein, partial [Vibrio parahaemolyticus VPTS-2009]
SQS